MEKSKNETFTITLKGRIEFDPDNKTRKQALQASWKKVAMVIFDGEIEEYYRHLFQKRFNLQLLSTARGAHVTFINDALGKINREKGTLEDKMEKWNFLKEKWNGKEIEITLNLRPFYDLGSDLEKDVPVLLTAEELAEGKKHQKVSHTYHWWLIVDHKFRDELQAIRAEIGLDRPFFGLHMTFGVLTQSYKLDNDGKLVLDSNEKPIPIFNLQLEHAKYLHTLHEKGFIEINKDYGKGQI